MPLLHSERSLYFNGSSAYVHLGAASELEFERTDSFSVGFWVKTSNNGTLTLLGNLEGSTTFRGWEVGCVSGQIAFSLNHDFTGGDFLRVISTTSVADGGWHHIVCTYDGSSSASGAKLYVDGALETPSSTDDTLTGTILSTQEHRIGARLTGTLFYLDGYLDEVAVYNSELSAADVLSVYGAGTPPDVASPGHPGGLVGYWHMGDGDVYPAITDHSPSGNDGVMTGMAASDITIDAARASGTHYSLLLDGSSKYIDIGTGTPLNSLDHTAAFSVSLWLKYTRLATQAVIGNLDDTLNFRGWEIVTSSGDNLSFQVIDVNNVRDLRAQVLTSSSFVRDGEWHHLVCTYDGSNNANGMAIYVDAVDYATVAENDACTTSVSTRDVRIGIRPNGTIPFLGALTEVSVWGKELSLAEVEALYNEGLARDARTIGATPSLIGYWSLQDKPSHPSVPDHSPYGNVGTSTGTTLSDMKLDSPGVSFFAPSVSSKSMSLTGSPVGYAEAATIGAYQFESSDPFTLCIWFKTTGSADAQLMGNTHPTSSKGWEVYISSTGQIFFQVLGSSASDGVVLKTLKSGFNDGVWHHVAVVYDGSATPENQVVYVDGVPSTTITDQDDLSSTIVSTAPVRFGARADDSMSFVGGLDEPLIFNRGLTEVEVRVIYGSRGQTGITEKLPSAHLVGYWTIGESAYPVVEDHSSNGNDAVAANSSFVEDYPSTLLSDYSVEFSGGAEVIQTATATPFNFERTQPFTVSAWVKPDITASQMEIVGNRDSGTSQGWALWIQPTDELAFAMANSLSDSLVVETVDPLIDGVWQHIAVTYDGSSSASGVRMYVAGEPVSSSVTQDNLSSTSVSTTVLHLGNSSAGTSPYVGYLDEVVIYDRVLAPSDIRLLGSQLFPQDHGALGPIDALLSWWRFGDAEGPSLYPTIPDAAVRGVSNGTMSAMSSGDIQEDTAEPLAAHLLWSSYGITNYTPYAVSSALLIPYVSLESVQLTKHKMVALSDPGPGYTTWVVDGAADFAGVKAPSPVQAGSAIESDHWLTTSNRQHVSTPEVEMVVQASMATTVPATGPGVAFVRVDTSQGTWNDLDTITLPSDATTGTEVIIKDVGGSASSKRITVDGGFGGNIDGAPTQVINADWAALHVVYGVNAWSVI